MLRPPMPLTTLTYEFEETPYLLTNAINRRTAGDIIVICVDEIASLGTIPTSKNNLA